MMKSMVQFVLGLAVFSVPATAVLFEDFETYKLGRAQDTTNSKWVSTSAQVVLGDNLSKGLDARSAVPVYASLGSFSIPDSDAQTTVFFRFYVATGSENSPIGVTDSATPSSYSHMDAYVQCISGNLTARNGSSSPTIISGIQPGWYNVWLVINNMANTYDVYVNQGLANASEADKKATGFTFRTPSTDSIRSFANVYGSGHLFDDIYITPGLELSNPPKSVPPSPDTIGGYFVTQGTGAEYSTVINGHFTLPGVASTGTINVPGWYSNQTVWSADTGTRHNDHSDGDGWSFSEKITDGPIWTVTQTRMIPGQSYSFLADVQGRWDCNRVYLSVVIGEDPNTGLGDPNVSLATAEYVIGGNGIWYRDLFVSYTATEADAGKHIGLKLEGSSTTNVNNSWIRYDNIRMIDGLVVSKYGPKNPQPEDKSWDIVPGEVTLTWIPSNDPNSSGQRLYYYIGTGNGFNVSAYNAVSPVVLPVSANSYAIGTLTFDQYVLWRVDTVIDGVVYTGPTWYFVTQTADFPPVVEAGYNYITWVGNLPQLLMGIVDDLGENDIADADVVWSIDSGPAGAEASVVKTSSNPLAPTALFTSNMAGTYIIRLTATDTGGNQGPQTSFDTLTVRVASDACAAQQMVQPGYNSADLNQDCIVDLEDLSVVAVQWLTDISLSASVPY
ncbi:MAG TPA: hypothetical protein PK054_07065 [Anaerohalosphaeraceae bacterium]|nr:hypothetical protein [Anaerohalosphaeraceae bacterium]HPP56330.1 hypothetical protein [Anaerohalosphaeraceae bacterium]